MQRLTVNFCWLFWKEIVHFFREPSVRTIYLLLPALSAPILLILGGEIALINKAGLIENPIKVSFTADTTTPSAQDCSIELKSYLAKSKSVEFIDIAKPDQALRDHKLDAIISIDAPSKTVKIESLERSVNLQLSTLINAAETEAMATDFNAKSVPANALSPFELAALSIKLSATKVFYQALGAVSVLFGLLLVGNLTAILTMGEFDYHTIETTLMQPSRKLAVAAKVVAAAIISVMPFTLGFLSFFSPTFFLIQILQLPWRIEFHIAYLLSIVATICLVCTFASLVDLCTCILMKGAKLSTITTSYVNGGIVLLAIVGYTMPIDINLILSFVPVLNVCCASKTIISGQFNWLCPFAYIVMFVQTAFLFGFTEPLFTLEDAITNFVIAGHKLLKIKNRVPER
ncbi:MAG TPA: hypothetical protein V6C86_23630 [Oculatellaceae cyanobacterium]